jgi:hypothetical protein
MSADSPDQLRDELKEAIARLREQIDIEERSGHYIGDGSITVGALAELRTELAQLEEALANL